MKTTPLRPLLLLLALLLLAGGWPHSAVHAQPPQPQITSSEVQPASGTPGTTFTFTVTGDWVPEERIEYWVFGPGSNRPFEMGEFVNQPDEAGRTVWTWTAPAGVWSGVWSMNARSIDGYLAVQIPFRITIGTTAPAPTSGVDPQRGTIGTTFTFFTDGWPKGDPVDFWVIAPGRMDAFAFGLIYGDPDEQGRTSWRWEVPDDAWSGTWIMSARGFYSEHFVQIPFVIEGPPPPPRPTISVTPEQASPGETLTFAATGFRAEEEVSFWVTAPYVDTPVYSSVRERETDEQGRITFQWTVPADAQVGQWTVSVFGFKSELQLDIDFDVVEPGSPPVDLSRGHVDPASGPAGTTFSFYATGFGAGEKLEYWLTNPEGQAISDNIPINADGQGSIQLQWASPPDTMGGIWMMTIQGTRYLHVAKIEFEVLNPDTPVEAEPGRVLPVEGPPGTTFDFFLGNLISGELVGWWATAPDGEVFDGGVDVTANRWGELWWSWTAPPDALPGTWRMVVESKQRAFVYEIPFEVLPPDTPPPEPPPLNSVTPEKGPPGTTFTFTTRALEPGEAIGYWATAPDSTVYPAPDEGEVNLSADKEGKLTWEWTAPEDAMAGQWTMTVQSSTVDDVEANTLIVIVFYIE
jgi:hypothetical protein